MNAESDIRSPTNISSTSLERATSHAPPAAEAFRDLAQQTCPHCSAASK